MTTGVGQIRTEDTSDESIPIYNTHDRQPMVGCPVPISPCEEDHEICADEHQPNFYRRKPPTRFAGGTTDGCQTQSGSSLVHPNYSNHPMMECPMLTSSL